MTARRKKDPRTDVLSARRESLFSLLDKLGLDGAILDNRDDIFYFTGYTGSDAAAAFSRTRRRGWLVTDARYREEAEQSASGLEIVIWKRDFAAGVGLILAGTGGRKMGYTPASLRLAFFHAMRRAAGVKSWLNIDPGISSLRAVKDAGEVAALEKALACAEAAFRAARKRWRTGMLEIEVRNDLEWEMRRRGADDAAFETIVAAGANASLPHAHAGRGRIAPGRMLLIDFGARLGRYNSDVTRTLWAEEVPAIWRRRYQAVYEASQAGTEAIRPGVAGREPYEAAVRVLRRRRLADRFTHSLGHGVGIAIHEEPRLSRNFLAPLEPGNVVTIEPGVYFPGSGGIRLEDMILVRPDGRRTLSTLERDIDDLVF